MFSLSPRERAGVRGKELTIIKCSFPILNNTPKQKTAAQISPRGGL